MLNIFQVNVTCEDEYISVTCKNGYFKGIEMCNIQSEVLSSIAFVSSTTTPTNITTTTSTTGECSFFKLYY